MLHLMLLLSPVPQARNLGVLFDSNSSRSGHISSITKSCFSNIRDLRRIRPILDQTTACNIATALVHSKLDYCNSLFLDLPANKLDYLQLVLNSVAHAVTRTPRFHHITPLLKTLHWLKISQSIHYRILSLINVLIVSITNLPTYAICSLFKLPPMRSSSVITLNLSALAILLVFRLPIDPSIILHLFVDCFD